MGHRITPADDVDAAAPQFQCPRTECRWRSNLLFPGGGVGGGAEAASSITSLQQTRITPGLRTAALDGSVGRPLAMTVDVPDATLIAVSRLAVPRSVTSSAVCPGSAHVRKNAWVRPVTSTRRVSVVRLNSLTRNPVGSLLADVRVLKAGAQDHADRVLQAGKADIVLIPVDHR